MATFEDNLYVFGGYTDERKCLGDLHRLNLGGDEWEMLTYSGECPSARTSHCMVIDEATGNLYVLCGAFFESGKARQHFADLYVLNLKQGILQHVGVMKWCWNIL